MSAALQVVWSGGTETRPEVIALCRHSSSLAVSKSADLQIERRGRLYFTEVPCGHQRRTSGVSVDGNANDANEFVSAFGCKDEGVKDLQALAYLPLQFVAVRSFVVHEVIVPAAL